ncbi:hypothetical protein DNTS_009409 [Danionella cerebrum]|uniref:RNA helicase n=1 Tax=Danionella cerebrum TaxID=2873325 RepID=A0A553NGC8_9TELE|nr:hypothetical protein DNTS_009409 [Danionella translucida]
MENEEEERRVCRELCNYTEHLRKYNDALIISLDARCKDALDYLDHFFEQVRNAEFDHTERKLAALFDRERAQLQILASEGQESPKLEELRFILEEEYHNNVNTRTVMFVRTRALAEAMKKWIDETESLKFLNPGVLIGKGRKSNVNSIRMTGTNQKGVLDSFKSSDQSKLLIATSVAEEGIDIPQCNLVLMYEYAGNVVKMVQVREKLNLLKESMVEKAVTDLQSNPVQLQRVVERLQRGDKQLRDFHSCSPKKPKTEESFQLLCGKCKKFACLSDNLRVIQESQHIVLDRSMFSRSIRAPHKKPISFCGFVKKEKLLCGDCKLDWGIVVSYLNIPELPLLKIESFVVQHCITKKQDYFRKWKEVTFAIREFDMNEITADMLRE